MSPAAQDALESIRIAMAETNAIFHDEIIGKRNFAALDLIYTADARILPPGAPMVEGREGIRDFWKNLVEGANVKSAVLTPVDAMPAGDGVVEIGSAAMVVEPEGGARAEMAVKYVVFWRQDDGRWKWHVDIWNANA